VAQPFELNLIYNCLYFSVIYLSIPCGVRGHLGSIHSKQEDMGSAIGDIQAAVTDLGLQMTTMADVHETTQFKLQTSPERV
jgi:hypothetical protein